MSIMVMAAAALAAGSLACPSHVRPETTYHETVVDGVKLFYREAGCRGAPTIVLLHGYPSSSRMYEPLLPLLAEHYHLIAPDYPGFGHSDVPPPARYA